jgi:hypothetical protein
MTNWITSRRGAIRAENGKSEEYMNSRGICTDVLGASKLLLQHSCIFSRTWRNFPVVVKPDWGGNKIESDQGFCQQNARRSERTIK